MDYYLKASSEKALRSALIKAGVMEEVAASKDEPGFDLVKEGDLDVIGNVYLPTGKMLKGENGSEYAETSPTAGFHANYRGELSEKQIAELGSLLIAEPSTPVRVWA